MVLARADEAPETLIDEAIPQARADYSRIVR
jgi:hypothetical protein